MMKKAGIIVAVAATGVLAVSSFAFADTSKGNLGNTCTFGNASGSAKQGLFGGTGLLGAVTTTITGTITQAATQTNTGNCTNVQLKDLLNDNSHNKTQTYTKAEVAHSYNQ